MTRGSHSWHSWHSLVLAATLASCGLIDSSVTNFELSLPAKKFTVDATSWDVSQSEADAFLGTSCASSPNVCSSAARQACPMNCAGSCNPSSKTCDLALGVSLHQPIDLVAEQPELKSIDDEPVIKVTIDSLTYEVASNSLTVATPAMTIYVAPMSVMDPGDPQAKPIGTIPAVAAGAVTDGPQQVELTATGRADLVAAMSTFKTPFNVIVGSTLVLTQGQPLPAGKLEAVVRITGHAGL